MVILVMTDGVRPDALDVAHCPNLKALCSRGASSMQARSVLPSVTLPCHMAIFHSVPPTRHGITTNLYIPLARPLPGLVETLRAAGRTSAFIYNWEPLRDLNRPETLHYGFFREAPTDETYDQAVADEARRVVADEHFDFVFVYFGSVDAAGHVYGWMEEGYLRQLERVDAYIGQLVEAMPRDATIIVHSDHGGHDRTHGTDSPEDMTIPWMIAGPQVRASYTITSPVRLLDTAPTITRLLGVAPQREWEGHSVDEAFVA